MDIFSLLTVRPVEIKNFLLSDKPNQVLISLEDRYRLHEGEGEKLTDLALNLLLGLIAVDDLPNQLDQILVRQSKITRQLEADFRREIVDPNVEFLKQTTADVQKFKAENNLPEVVVFSVPKSKHATTASVPMMPRHPVPTTSDIRRPIKFHPEPAEGLPATPVRSRPEAAEGALPSGGGMSKLDQFQLRTVEDLINVPPATLAQEPDDEKQLVGRFKQEIQDIANYSGAKRVEIAAGWKKSQLYHTYIEMGNESIQQGKPIGDIESFRKASGKPYLTENQFHAVSEVSRLLLR